MTSPTTTTAETAQVSTKECAKEGRRIAPTKAAITTRKSGTRYSHQEPLTDSGANTIHKAIPSPAKAPIQGIRSTNSFELATTNHVSPITAHSGKTPKSRPNIVALLRIQNWTRTHCHCPVAAAQRKLREVAPATDCCMAITPLNTTAPKASFFISGFPSFDN